MRKIYLIRGLLVIHFPYIELKFYIKTIFTKLSDWEYEKEIRFVLIFGDDIDEEIRVRDIDNFKMIDAMIRDRYKELRVMRAVGMREC